MLTKSHIKLIRSLEYKKYRTKHNLFVAEGKKVVIEFLNNQWNPYLIVCTEKAAENFSNTKNLIVTNSETIAKISFLKNPSEVLGVFYQKELKRPISFEKSFGIALDEIQDAGNVGTILRIALWFGFDYVVLGNGCADKYSPKVVQASMGALAQIPCWHEPIESLLTTYSNVPVYGMYLEGSNIYNVKKTNNGIFLLGNEGKGISPAYEPYVSHKLFIPPYNNKEKPIDSLNVATAAAIVCYEFRRK